MPGPHFNSKRLKAAKNVRAEFAPGSVPRVGTRLFTLRLLPRTVEKNCGCRIPLPPPVVAAPPAVVVTITTAHLKNNNQILDMTNQNNNGIATFFDTYLPAVGDEVIIIHPTTNVELTRTINFVETANGVIHKVYVTPNHGFMSPTQPVTIKLIDNR